MPAEAGGAACPLDIPGLGRPLRLKLHDVPERVSETIRQHRIWEPYETALIVRHLKPGDVFLDVGANIGYYTVLAGALVGGRGGVIAYEPEARNFALLQANIDLNGLTNVRPFRAALGEHNGTGTMYLCAENRGDHQLHAGTSDRPTATVEILNGDAHLAPLTRRVDFIKIDTQGFEVHILRGLAEVIRANRAHLSMVIECWPHGLRRTHTSGTELLELLAGYDRPLFIIDHLAHRLIPVGIPDLQRWVDETDAAPDNEGFMNLFLSAQRMDRLSA